MHPGFGPNWTSINARSRASRRRAAMEESSRFVHGSWQVDLGDGKLVEAELDHATLWIALGRLLDGEVWIKSVAGEQDFRVKLKRNPGGFEVILDRRASAAPWWPEAEAPRLGVRIDQVAKRIFVYFRTGEPRATEVTVGEFTVR